MKCIYWHRIVNSPLPVSTCTKLEWLFHRILLLTAVTLTYLPTYVRYLHILLVYVGFAQARPNKHGVLYKDFFYLFAIYHMNAYGLNSVVQCSI